MSNIDFEIQSLAADAQDFQIVTAADAQAASDFLGQIKTMRKQVTDTFEPICQKAHAAWKETVAQRDKHLQPLDDATALIKSKCADWHNEQERIRQEQLRKAQEAAEAEERKRREEEAAQLLEDAERSLQLDDTLSADTERAMAAEILSAPVVVAVPAPAAAPKIDGQSVRYDYDFTITDAKLLPREYLVPDEKAIRKVVKALKDKCCIPGVQVMKKTIVVSK